MIFVDAHRASPVALGIEKPDKMDYFHQSYNVIDNKFLEEGDFIIDEDWWHEQLYRCLFGVYIPNGIAPGCPEGETESLLRDGIECIWSNNYRDCYLPEYDLMMKDRTLYIPGRMYFYLNFWWIKGIAEGQKIKDVIHPMFTDLSWLNWITREAMLRFDKDSTWFKARQRGLSEEAAADVAFEYLFLPNSQSVIVACEDKYNQNTMNMVIRGLERLVNTQFFKAPLRGHDRNDYKKNIIGSEIWSMTAKNNLQVLSGKTPSLTYVEEVGIWQEKKIPELYEFIYPSIYNLGQKTGRINYIGTGGTVDDGIKDMEIMFYTPEAFNLLSFKNRYDTKSDKRIAYFVSVLAFNIIDNDGNSKISAASKKEDNERAKKTDGGRYKYIILNPKQPSELFNLSTGGFFGPERIQWASDRKNVILTQSSEQREHRYRLEWLNAASWRDGVKAIPYKESDGIPLHLYNVYLSEPPERDGEGKVIKGLYYQGTDSYDQTEAKTSESKGASVIWKGFKDANTTYNKPVAFLLERPNEYDGGRDTFYENTAKLAVLYGTQNMIEHSKILIFQWYESKSMTSLLALKPEFTVANMVNKSMTSNKYGLDASVINEALTMLRDKLDFNTINKIDSVTLLNAIAYFKLAPGYNCDVTIAMALAIVQYQEVVYLREKNTEAYKKQNQVSTLKYRKVNGKIIMTR